VGLVGPQLNLLPPGRTDTEAHIRAWLGGFGNVVADELGTMCKWDVVRQLEVVVEGGLCQVRECEWCACVGEGREGGRSSGAARHDSVPLQHVYHLIRSDNQLQAYEPWFEAAWWLGQLRCADGPKSTQLT
jgi:hypothetical protein